MADSTRKSRPAPTPERSKGPSRGKTPEKPAKAAVKPVAGAKALPIIAKPKSAAPPPKASQKVVKPVPAQKAPAKAVGTAKKAATPVKSASAKVVATKKTAPQQTAAPAKPVPAKALAAPKKASAPVKTPVVKAAPAPKPAPAKPVALPVKAVPAAKATPSKTLSASVKAAPQVKGAATPKLRTLEAGGGSFLLQGATWVTLNMVREIFVGDVRVENGRIAAMGERLKPRKDEKVVDLKGLTVFPGFVQLHVHLCQTLFRHMAEDLALFDWLRSRIWPLEAAHNAVSMAISAKLGITELLLGGTTTVFTMESTLHTEAVFQELLASGMRAFSGKSLMDSGRGVPPELREETTKSLDLARRHLADFDGKGRLRVTLNPRFAPSCSADLLKGVGALAKESGAWIHTHIAETRDEVQLTREVFGRNPVQLYEALGYLDGKFLGVHAVWLTDAEKLHLAGRRSTVLVHCPSANLKLGSGIAPLSDLLSRGIRVGLGADGAACNNNLSVMEELRLAGLLQKFSRGAATLSAERLLELATIDAAKAVGLEEEIGSIEVGKKADLACFDLNHPSIQVAGSPAQQLIWSASPRDLVHTLVEGEFLVRDRKVRRTDAAELIKTARAEAKKLVTRAGLDGKIRV